MKITQLIVLLLLSCSAMVAQEVERVKAPKRASRIQNADTFVNASFDLQHKVFVYDSLQRAGYETTAEEEDFIIESMRSDIDSLLSVAPDLIDDLSSKVSLKTAKAVINLNKAKKALRVSLKMVKSYVLDEEEEVGN